MPMDPNQVKSGPGKLYFGAVGAAEPTHTVVDGKFTDVWGVAWTQVGYTDEGHTFTYAPNFEDVEVAEEMLAIRTVQTGLEMTLEFAAAELLADNIQKALNGGTITTTGSAGTQLVKFSPPAFGVSTRVAIGWESDEADERWVYRKCIQTGEVALARKKAPEKVVLPMSFRLEVVGGGVLPFDRWSTYDAAA